MSDSSYGSDDLNFENFIPRFINNEYVLLKQIGHGGYSIVFISYSVKKKKYYAIKIQNPSHYDDAENEAKIINKLSAKNPSLFVKMAETFDLYLEDDDTNICFCFVFELMACTVYSLIRQGKYENGLPLEIVKDILFQIISAVKIMHDMGVVHSDIKPENILIGGTRQSIEEIKAKFESFNFEEECRKKIVKKTLVSRQNKKATKSGADAKKETYNEEAEKIYKLINNLSENSESSFSSELSGELSASSSSDSNFDRYLLSSEESISSNSDDSVSSATKYDTLCESDEIKLLANIKVKLTDFGGSFYINKKPKHPVQTRYYKAPEMILKCDYNEKCDVWAIGCVAYELLAGDILFDPQKKHGCSTNRNHIYEMQRTLGLIPQTMILQSKRSDVFFRLDGSQKGIYNFVPHLLIDKLTKIKNTMSDDEFQLVYDFINKTLSYDHSVRMSINECLHHPFLKK